MTVIDVCLIAIVIILIIVVSVGMLLEKIQQEIIANRNLLIQIHNLLMRHESK